MKLRTRLFLWVGVIFFLAFGASLVFEIRTTDKSLETAEKQLRNQILDLNEEKRKNIENYVHIALSEDQAQIDSLLLRISRDPKLGAQLFLEPKHLNLVAPAHSAYLFKNDRWIDLIQTTKNGQLTSLFIPIDFPMKTAHEIPIDDQISWIVLHEDTSLKMPYIGIKLIDGTDDKKGLSLLIDEQMEFDWGLTVFFHPEALLNYKPGASPIRNHTLEGVDLTAFLASVEHAVSYLKKVKTGENWIQKDIRSKAKGDFFKEKPFDRGIQCLKEEGEVLNIRIIEFLERGDQAIMLSSLAALFPSDAFGASFSSPLFPQGIGRFPVGARTGHLILTDEVFFQKKIFDDATYQKNHPSSNKCEEIGSSVAVIAPPSMGRVFVGNTLEIKDSKGQGYLTIGIDAEEFVEDLVLAVGRDAFLVHDGKIISAFKSNGTEIQDIKTQIDVSKDFLKKQSGLIEWNGKNYYFLHMVPFKNLDLHFYILEPEKEAFALVRSIDEGSREVIHKVSLNMRIIAIIALIGVLLLLHRVAKRITKPITQMASVTKDVAAGKLEDIKLPKIPEGRHDEIATLLASFDQMVNGLKEKEKVKGILNKVVSPEIAAEITKEQIHLGGEEKKVTVFFADIRNFTHMSAEKSPQEVIEMLNLCMTKVSHVIDEHGGVIDKYVGDEVMALFGAPIEKEDSTLKAIESGLRVVEVLKEWNQERAQKGLPPVEMGIGIHTGVVLIGNMGAENRLNYTVIGSNVNLAARLCAVAKGMEILITKDTLEETHVKESIEVEEMPPSELKGFDESFVLYRVKGRK